MIRFSQENSEGASSMDSPKWTLWPDGQGPETQKQNPCHGAPSHGFSSGQWSSEKAASGPVAAQHSASFVTEQVTRSTRGQFQVSEHDSICP